MAFAGYESLTPSTNPVDAASGDSIVLPMPAKAGHTFNGWYNGSIRVNSPYAVAGDVTLTAKWTAPSVEYTVTFYDGSDVVRQQTLEIGAAVDMSVFAKTGYTFDGWYDNAGLTGAPVTAYTVSGNASFWGKWTEIWIEVRTLVELNNIRNNLSGHYRLMNDISLSAYGTGEGWEPIGDYVTQFTGSLDGNGYAVKDLYINRTTDHVGLFGCIGNGKISNLGVEIASDGVKGSNYVGGIAGQVHSSTIENSYSTSALRHL